jgi:hypothetical protein
LVYNFLNDIKDDEEDKELEPAVIEAAPVKKTRKPAVRKTTKK